jgi:hypothetical protein
MRMSTKNISSILLRFTAFFAIVFAIGMLPALASAQPGITPGTCVYGFVWREAFPGDRVCVTPQTRQETAADNAASPGRTLGNGRCLQGFVWREAGPGDHACVTPETRSRAAKDNKNAFKHTVP